MTDKATKFTSDGYAAPGSGGSFSIPITTGTLSETNSTYMFEITVVGHGAATAEYFGIKAYYYINKKGASVVLDTMDIVASNASGYTSASLAASYGSGAVAFSVLLPLAHNGFWWRAFVDVYSKDDAST